MPETSDLTILLVGPVGQRAPLTLTLQRAGCRIEPDQGVRGHHHGFADLRDDGTLGSLAVRHHDLDEVVGLARQAGWSLRLHHNTPACGVCGGRGEANAGDAGLGACLHCEGRGVTNRPAPSADELVRAELAELRAEIAALKGSR